MSFNPTLSSGVEKPDSPGVEGRVSSFKTVEITACSLLAVFAAIFFIDPGSSRVVVSPECDTYRLKEAIHTFLQAERPFCMTVNTSFALKDEKRISQDINEIDIVVYDEGGFFVDLHGTANRLRTFHPGVGI